MVWVLKRDGSFELLKHMLKLIDKENIAILRSKQASI